MRRLRFAALALVVCASVASMTAAAGTGATTAYDYLFRSGTLDTVPHDRVLVYDKAVRNDAASDEAESRSGRVELSFVGDAQAEARLTFRRDGKHRGIGDFPAKVGNPVIMYFIETVVRDMAESAGGSPFYIRNRVKDALAGQGEIETASIRVDGTSVEATEVTLHPFKGDPNAKQMNGFDALTLTAVMSKAVPGWYHSLEARVPATGDDGDPVYLSRLSFERIGAAAEDGEEASR